MGPVLAVRQAICIGAALSVLLSGCGDYDPSVLKRSAGAITGVFKKPEPPQTTTPAQLRARLTPELLANEPRDLLIVTVQNTNVTALLTQTGQNGATRTYATPDGTTLSLTNGVLVASRGLGFDLMSTDSQKTLVSLSDRTSDETYNRRYIHLDGENQNTVTQLRCILGPQGDQGVLLERCSGVERTIENSYVRASDGRPAASRQWVSPQTGYLLFEHVLR